MSPSVYNYKGKRKKGSNYNLNNIADFYKKEICCFDCGYTKNLHREHLTPVGLGGIDELDNLQILCKLCHDKKTKLEKDPKQLRDYLNSHVLKVRLQNDRKLTLSDFM